jgi:hypothetical protein
MKKLHSIRWIKRYGVHLTPAATGYNQEKTNFKSWRITGLDNVLSYGSLAFFIFQPP